MVGENKRRIFIEDGSGVESLGKRYKGKCMDYHEIRWYHGFYSSLCS